LFQPALWAVLALVPLLASALAGAQPRPAARERQMVNTRQLVLPNSATGSLPEVRVARGMPTTIIFDAALARDFVKLEGEGTRIRRVDVGDTSVTVEPLVELGQERALLRVRFVDGAAPAEAALALVSDPALVDSHVRVGRRAHSAEELEKDLAEVRARCEAQKVELAELRARCEANGLVALVLAGLLGKDDLKDAGRLISDAQESGASGLKMTTESWVKVAPKWMLLAVVVTLSALLITSPQAVAPTSGSVGENPPVIGAGGEHYGDAWNNYGHDFDRPKPAQTGDS